MLAIFYAENDGEGEAKHEKIVNGAKAYIFEVFVGLEDIEFAHNDAYECQDSEKDCAPYELVFLN